MSCTSPTIATVDLPLKQKVDELLRRALAQLDVKSREELCDLRDRIEDQRRRDGWGEADLQWRDLLALELLGLRRTASAEASVRVSIGNFLPKVSELRQLALADEAELPRALPPARPGRRAPLSRRRRESRRSVSPRSAPRVGRSWRTKSGTRDISASVGAPPMTCCYRLHDQET